MSTISRTYAYGMIVLFIAFTACAIVPLRVHAQSTVSTAVSAGLGGAAGGLAGSLLGNALSGSGASAAATAAGNLGGSTAADAMCAVYIPTKCGCGMQDGPNGTCIVNAANKYACPLGACVQTQNNVPVAGVCTAVKHCQAVTVGGVAGGSGSSIGSLGSLAGVLGQLLGQLMNGSNSSNSNPSSASTIPTTGTTCASYYPESTTQYPTDPCSYYVAPTTSQTTSTSNSTCALEDELDGTCNSSGTTGTVTTGTVTTGTTGTSTGTGITIPIITGNNPSGNTGTSTDNNNNTNNNTNTNGNGPSSADITGTFTSNTPPPTGAPPQGISGGIQTTATGATFVGNNVATGTETSVFFGGDSIGGFVTNMVAGWCEARPWASGFIASIIPPSFFDGLCTANGFNVGPPQAPVNTNNTPTQIQTNVGLTQTQVFQSPNPAPVDVTASTTPYIPAIVDIWAVPTSVPLGSRTTIFWNTENVSDCTESSPDGSFSESSLTGGAATVPLTQPTTYTISCLDSQNNPATSYVTVGISD